MQLNRTIVNSSFTPGMLVTWADGGMYAEIVSLNASDDTATVALTKDFHSNVLGRVLPKGTKSRLPIEMLRSVN